jgi:hypothetical protein
MVNYSVFKSSLPNTLSLGTDRKEKLQKFSKLFFDSVHIPWGELSMGRVVRGASCPWGKLSVGQIVRGANCPWDEMSVGRNVCGAKCLWGEMSVGRNVCGASCRGASCHGASCHGASFDRASCLGASGPGTRFFLFLMNQPHINPEIISEIFFEVDL